MLWKSLRVVSIFLVAFIKVAIGQVPDVKQEQTISKAGIFFEIGLVNLQNDRQKNATNDFNGSVEVFLRSGIDLSSGNNRKAAECYNELIQTIYRIEYPNRDQLPQIRNLYNTCGWKIGEPSLINSIDSRIAKKANAKNPTAKPKTGFNAQEFEPSPLDELSKLELTPNVVMVVKAKAGDTVQKVAERYGADPVAVAKLNGLLPQSVLGVGREIQISKEVRNTQQEATVIKPPPQTSIRQVDFRNFTYSLMVEDQDELDDESKTVTVKNGEYITEVKNGFHQGFYADKVIYGDITGDGEEDALVDISIMLFGGSPAAYESTRAYYIFTLRNGKTEFLTRLDILSNYPKTNARNVFLNYKWDGNKLVLVRKPIRKKTK